MYIDTCIAADPLELSRATTEEGEKLPQFAIARDRGMRLLAITSLRIILGLYNVGIMEKRMETTTMGLYTFWV